MTIATTEEVLELIGDPAQLDRDLQQFRRAARVLSSKHSRLIDKYPKQWVAVYRGRVRAQARTFRSLLVQVDKKALPRDEVIVRFIHKDQRTIIL